MGVVQLFEPGFACAARSSIAIDPLAVDQALEQLSPLFEALYAPNGRTSIAPEKLLRALLLQAFYGVRNVN